MKVWFSIMTAVKYLWVGLQFLLSVLPFLASWNEKTDLVVYQNFSSFPKTINTIFDKLYSFLQFYIANWISSEINEKKERVDILINLNLNLKPKTYFIHLKQRLPSLSQSSIQNLINTFRSFGQFELQQKSCKSLIWLMIRPWRKSMNS